MQDYQAARENMVESQIHTMGVVSAPVLEAFRTIRREEFVPADKRGVAYTDEDLRLGHGRVLMEPVTQARLVQALAPTSMDKALDVGCGTGYSSAILAGLCARVVATDPNANLLAESEKNWSRLGYGNITARNVAFSAGCPDNAPYDVILVNGSVAQVPQALVDLLANGGRMAVIIRAAGDRIGRALLVAKDSAGLVGKTILFDASVPYLPGCEPANEFVF